MEPYTHILLSVLCVLTIFGVYQDILESDPWFHSYQLSHTYDRFLGSTLTNRAKPEEEDLVPASSDEGL